MAAAARLVRPAIPRLSFRPLDEFDAAHLPDAISIPLEEIRERRAALARDRELAAYCRGPYRVLTC